MWEKYGVWVVLMIPPLLVWVAAYLVTRDKYPWQEKVVLYKCWAPSGVTNLYKVIGLFVFVEIPGRHRRDF